MTADRLDLDALADLEAEATAASERTDGQHVLTMRPLEVLDLIAAARENDDLRASLGDAQRLTSDAYERASTSLMRRVDLAMEAARTRAERDAAQAALDATVITARNRLDEIHRLRAELETAQAALAPVKALHWGRLGPNRPGTCNACNEHYPCTTIRAVMGEGQEAGGK